MMSALTSCAGAKSSEDKKRTNWSSSNVNDVIQSRIDEENQKSSTDPSASTTSAASDATTEATTEGTIAPPADGIDVDLTVLSSTMVYSEVYNMMTKPDDYIGKMVKMAGPLASYHDEASGKWYYACIIQDATACCSQGIEFELAGKTAPDGYPADGSDICVIGVFDTYKEGENTYCTLRNAELG